MASPFRVFRKYLKPLMVVFGVMIMFVFVVLDPMAAYLGGGGRVGGGDDPSADADAVAVTWDGGSLTNRDLSNLVMRRRIVNQFIRGVEYQGRLSAIEAGTEPVALRVSPLIGPETPQQGVEQSVLQTKLFAQAARDAGMRVSDEAIVNYLDELGRNRVSRDDMRSMLNQMQGGARVPISYILDALREEMLAHNYLTSFRFSFETVTPHQLYQDWLKLNDRVVVEAAAIPVESYVVDVPDPKETELTAFFNEHKEREPQPDFLGSMELPSPTPGFRIPRKIDLQFVEANYEEYLAQAEEQVTEEEIANYYEENKDPRFIKSDTGLFDAPATEPAEQQDSPAEQPADQAAEPADETMPADTPETIEESLESADQPAETPSESADQSAGETQSEEPTAGAVEVDTTQNEAPSSDNQRTGNEPAADDANGTVVTSADEAANEDAANESAPAESDQGLHRVIRGSALALAALLQQPATGDAATQDATEQVANEAATDASARSQDSAAPAADAATTEAAPATEETAKVFQPLDEVRDIIRRDIARQRVSDQLDELINRLYSQVNAEFNQYYSARLDAEATDQPAPAPPPELANLEPLAKEHGLGYGRTGPMSWLQLRETPVGKSTVADTPYELWRILYFGGDDHDLYQPITTIGEGFDANRYIVSKTSDTPGRVPELSEVRDEVVQAWKRTKAAELALKQAEAEATKAQEAGSPLSDYFAGQPGIEVVRTDPFSRYTGGEVGVVNNQLQREPLRLSQPDVIAAAGPEFMDEVFSLKDGEVGAVLNHDHSIAYIVRIAEHQMSPEELRSTYLSEANYWPGMEPMINDHTRRGVQLLAADILKQANVEWNRDPDEIQQDEE